MFGDNLLLVLLLVGDEGGFGAHTETIFSNSPSEKSVIARARSLPEAQDGGLRPQECNPNF